jgi:hypothetical protein
MMRMRRKVIISGHQVMIRGTAFFSKIVDDIWQSAIMEVEYDNKECKSGDGMWDYQCVAGQ